MVESFDAWKCPFRSMSARATWLGHLARPRSPSLLVINAASAQHRVSMIKRPRPNSLETGSGHRSQWIWASVAGPSGSIVSLMLEELSLYLAILCLPVTSHRGIWLGAIAFEMLWVSHRARNLSLRHVRIQAASARRAIPLELSRQKSCIISSRFEMSPIKE